MKICRLCKRKFEDLYIEKFQVLTGYDIYDRLGNNREYSSFYLCSECQKKELQNLLNKYNEIDGNNYYERFNK